MNLIGQAVKHKAFGPGVVTDLSKEIVTICFQNMEKQFIYPDAFAGFLVLKDQDTQRHIEKQIEEREKEAQKLRKAEQAELDRKHKLLSFTISANSHAVFDIPCAQIEQVIQLGIVSTGTYLSGYSKGMPRIAERVKPNSLCLLTVRPKGRAERDRCILGAFMVAEDFFGEEAHDGLVKGHTDHRIRIPKENQVLFWEYFGQAASPRWGNTAFKYCSGDMANRILADLTTRLAGSGQQDAAADFYEYFCRINRLSPLIKLRDENDSEGD